MPAELTMRSAAEHLKSHTLEEHADAMKEGVRNRLDISATALQTRAEAFRAIDGVVTPAAAATELQLQCRRSGRGADAPCCR